MKLQRIAVLALLLSLTACATVRPGILDRAFNDDVDEARKLVTNGHLKQAVDELTLLLGMDPKNQEARFLRGVAYQNLEEFDMAVKDYEAVIEVHPGYAKAHYNLGMIFGYKLHDPERALQHFDGYLSFSTDQNKAFTVAKIMCSIDASRRNPDAADLEKQALPDLVRRIGELKDSSEKRKELMKAVPLNPNSPVPWYWVGKTYEEEGKEADAIRAYKEAIHIRPTCAPCHQSLGRLLTAKKESKEGRIHLVKADLFDPNKSQGGFAE